GVRVFGDVTYRADGTVTWDGTSISQRRTQQFVDHGVWRVEGGYLCTTVTNSAVNQFALRKEYRDELISATDSEFTYRTASGNLEARLREAPMRQFTYSPANTYQARAVNSEKNSGRRFFNSVSLVLETETPTWFPV